MNAGKTGRWEDGAVELRPAGGLRGAKLREFKELLNGLEESYGQCISTFHE